MQWKGEGQVFVESEASGEEGVGLYARLCTGLPVP
jgi:hypothetical protein